jgi:hypothetical protein
MARPVETPASEAPSPSDARDSQRRMMAAIQKARIARVQMHSAIRMMDFTKTLTQG